jgi:hypothetical protein
MSVMDNSQLGMAQMNSRDHSLRILSTILADHPRGVFRNPKDREETAQTRGLGACIRCRMQRIRVSCFHDQEASMCDLLSSVSQILTINGVYALPA